MQLVGIQTGHKPPVHVQPGNKRSLRIKHGIFNECYKGKVEIIACF